MDHVVEFYRSLSTAAIAVAVARELEKRSSNGK
jgi:hypothetical protein